MSTLEVNTINPQSGTTITLGSSGDTVTLGSGATPSGLKENIGYVGRLTSNPVVSGNTDTKLTFSTSIRNEGSAYNTSTGVFTAPVAGIYQVNCFMQHDGFSGSWQTEIWVNGSSEYEFVLEHGSHATYPSSGISASVYLALNDYFEIYVRHNSTNKTVYSSQWSHLSANLITEV